MPSMRVWLSRFAGLFARRGADERLRAELDSHLAMLAEENERRGLPPAEARRQAKVTLGGVEQTKQLYREQRGIPWLESLLADFHSAARSLGRNRGSALAIIVLLALGIGGTAALFGPLYSLVLSPLPYPHSNRIVRIGVESLTFAGDGVEFPHRAALRSTFSSVAAYAPALLFSQPVVFPSAGAAPVRVHVVNVTPQFFATLGVEPLFGQDLSNEPWTASVAVVSHRFWRTVLHGAGNVIGRPLKYGDGTVLVAGVMPPGFDFPSGTDMWTPMSLIDGEEQVLGLLRPGLTLDPAAAQLEGAGFKPGRGPSGTLGSGPVLETLHDFLLGDRKPLLWTLWSVSLLFLLLACAGAANLLFARGVRRQPEMVVRLALGAGRGRLVRQLLAEALLLAAAGGLLGLGLAAGAGRWIEALLPAAHGAKPVSFASLGLVVLLAFVATILCGLAPAFEATGGDLNAFLKTGTGGITRSPDRRRFFSSHELLSGSQLVLATVLLISTGLLLRSLVAHLRYSLGFDPHNVALVEPGPLPVLPALAAAENKYFHEHHMASGPLMVIAGATIPKLRQAVKQEQEAQNARNEQFYQEARRRLARLPGVVSVGVVDPPPFTTLWAEVGPAAASATPKPGPSVPHVHGGIMGVDIGPDALRVLRIPLLAGRSFTEADVAQREQGDVSIGGANSGRTGVAIIDQTLAEAFWPHENPIGKAFFTFTGEEATVVGVAANVHETAEILNIVPTYYLPFEPAQGYETFAVRLRPGASLSRFSAGAREALASLVPGMAPPAVRTLEDLTTASQANLRLALALLACFSFLGIVVAALGVYAAATLMGAARTREMGIRIALGAHAEQIRGLAVWRSLRLILVALPLGALCAWGLARSLSHWLFQVGAADPATYLVSVALLALIALGAGLVPARRAARIDPVIALREE